MVGQLDTHIKQPQCNNGKKTYMWCLLLVVLEDYVIKIWRIKKITI